MKPRLEPSRDNSLQARRNACLHNWEASRANYPFIAEAAEGVHQAFDALLTQHSRLSAGRLADMTRWRCAVAAHSDWTWSYLMASSGYRANSLMILRRAIEYVAYTSKIGSSEKRARLFIEQLPGAELSQQEKEALLRRFIRQFSIPTAYAHSKYRHVQHLLGIYDLASDQGTHANFVTLLHKETLRGQSAQDEPEHWPRAMALMVLFGSWLVKGFDKALEDMRVQQGAWVKVLDAADASVQRMRIRLAQLDGCLDATSLEFITSDRPVKAIEIFESSLRATRGKPPPTFQQLTEYIEDVELSPEELERLRSILVARIESIPNAGGECSP